MAVKRVIIIVLDSVGIGELPDAADFGDAGSCTLVNTAAAVEGVKLPNLEIMGLGNIADIPGLNPVSKPAAAYGKMAEKSAGKDTTTGHWEITGLILDTPFPVYPDGFPQEVIHEFEDRVGRKVLGNVAASGTEIIKELGREHMETGRPIVYTSADSVFQVAAHEEIIPLEDLYDICRKAREILKGKYAVGRVIARPFIGVPGSFERTGNRKDYSLEPPQNTLLDNVAEAGMEVVGIGKINDIFAGKGITRSIKTEDNMDGVDKTIEELRMSSRGLVLVNLVDFDMKFGHRNDPEGYAAALENFDRRLPEILEEVKKEDILFITADHGCDPTTPSTDHSREYVPLFAYGDVVIPKALKTRETFADLGATAADFLGVAQPPYGTGFKDCLCGKADG